MADAIAFLSVPFCIASILVGIHAYLGIHVLSRNIIFVDLALAQISALGATVAYMLGYPPQSLAAYGYALAFTFAGAALLSFTRGWTGRISQETFIGIIYVVSAAAAFLLVDRSPQGAEHIKQILVGSILTTTWEDALKVLLLYGGVGILHWFARDRFVLASLQPDLARASGMRLWLWDFAFYASFGIVVTSSVAIAGVLLVFSMLIVPATIGTLYCMGLTGRLLVGWAAGFGASLLGLSASYVGDLPTGAAMVCAFGLTLVVAAALKPLVFVPPTQRRRFLTGMAVSLRESFFVLLLVSGLWLCVNPHADQPLLDALDLVQPGVRSFFLTADERFILTDAAANADFLRSQILALDEKERESRWLGEALSDEELRTLTSYTISFQEMEKGEDFVQRTLRNKARERQRWSFGIPAISLAIAYFWYRRITLLRSP